MHTPSILRVAFALLGLSLGTLTAPTPSDAGTLKIDGEVIPGSYIVKLKDGADKDHLITSLASSFASKFQITHDYDADVSTARKLDGTLLTRELPSYSDPRLLRYVYDYYDTAGAGVNVYVVDTGINAAHQDFRGRAYYGYSAFPSHYDGNGHGTHCAGTAVGSTYGVARNARVIAVKVLGDNGSGSTSDIIAGMNYVVQQHRMGGYRTPSVMSMSLGGPAQVALDQAATACVNNGVHTIVAAGNDGKDASFYSPARAARVITVGSINIVGARSAFSNWGQAATPHVSGIAAMILGQFGNLSTDQLTAYLLQYADRSTSYYTPVAQIPWGRSITAVQKEDFTFAPYAAPPVHPDDVQNANDSKQVPILGY
ncbi:subtilisin-like serine protease [Tulasnella sp. 403]|nr:subtilisin-like serine protease [Tulasnella sp. 403]